MKLLHTADWHLGDRLGRVDRTDDLRRAVERVAEYSRDEKIDVLLVAGDLFSELARPDGLREAVRHVQDTFEQFLRRGGTILAVTGNHDNENFCETLRHAMALAAPAVGGFGTLVPAGRLHLAAGPSLLRLRDPKSGGDVQFVLMPYPTPARFLTNEALQRYRSFEEKNRFLEAAFGERLREIRADSRFDPSLPTVLMAHINVRGPDVPPTFRMAPADDLFWDAAGLAAQYSYVALGHVHKPHAVGGHPNVRYCGSIERMDLGEQNDQKCVIALELGPSGLVEEPTVFPLNATPMYEVEILNPTRDIPVLAERYRDHETALVDLHVRYTAGVDSLEEILRDLDRVFPRWYCRDWAERGDIGPALNVSESAPTQSCEATVRDYLKTELQGHSEDDRTAVLALAEDLLRASA
jgi:exonuclease SbcD